MHEGLWVRVLLRGCVGDGAVASELAGVAGNGNVLKNEGLSGAAVCSSVMVSVLVSSPSNLSCSLCLHVLLNGLVGSGLHAHRCLVWSRRGHEPGRCSPSVMLAAKLRAP